MIAAALLEKYLATTYAAELAGGPLRIRIGGAPPALAVSWAFVTAENPGSGELSPEENQRRTQGLAVLLAARGWVFHRGQGIPDHPGWTAENSFLVLGIPREVAVQLGRQYGQNAIVAGLPGESAQLVECDEP